VAAQFERNVWVAQATGLCRPATRRTEWKKANFLCLRSGALWMSNHSGRRVADRNGRVARSTHFYRGAKTLEKLFCREQSQNCEAGQAASLMIATIDFSKASASDIVVACIFFAWALVSLFFWFEGYEKEPKARSAMEIILKHSPPWWRIVTWIVTAIIVINFLLDIILPKIFKV
jgi:hypothetical protein